MSQHPEQNGQPARPQHNSAGKRLALISAGGVLAVIVIASWAVLNSNSASPASQQNGVTTVTTAPAGPTAGPADTTAPVASSCTPWPGLPYLSDASVDMYELAGDEGIYGMGSEQVNSDQLGVTADQAGLMSWRELPAPYAEDVQNEVIAVDPDDASTGQLNAAAADAETLYSAISTLCPAS
jgi:hypothetical protein